MPMDEKLVFRIHILEKLGVSIISSAVKVEEPVTTKYSQSH